MQLPAQSQMMRTGGADPRNMMAGGWQNPNAPQTGLSRLPNPGAMSIMGGQNEMGGGMPQMQQQQMAAPPAPSEQFAPQAQSPQDAALLEALMGPQPLPQHRVDQMLNRPQMSRANTAGQTRAIPTRATPLRQYGY